MFKEKKKLKILDIGTGSGCLLFLWQRIPNAKITAIDISQKKL